MLIQQQENIFIWMEGKIPPLIKIYHRLDEDHVQVHCWSLEVYFQKDVKLNT